MIPVEKQLIKELFLIPILIIVEIIFEILIPIFMSKLIDDGVNAVDSFGVASPNKEVIIYYGVLMIISAVIALVFGVLVTKTTVRENIRYGKLDATDEDVIVAAKLANAHEFILKTS